MVMKTIVDADACPVKEIVVRVCREYGIEVIMVIDTSHVLNSDYAKIITVDKGADSADIYLINIAQKGDIIVTQDYGVAAMALGKQCSAINQNGMTYDSSNIDSLLFARHIGKKVKRAGGRLNSIPKRTKEDDRNFEEAFRKLIEKTLL